MSKRYIIPSPKISLQTNKQNIQPIGTRKNSELNSNCMTFLSHAEDEHIFINLMNENCIQTCMVI